MKRDPAIADQNLCKAKDNVTQNYIEKNSISHQTLKIKIPRILKNKKINPIFF